MRLGRLEIALLSVLICGTLYLAVQYLPFGRQQMCGPVPLSPEVKAYIDRKLEANASNAQCGDIPAMVSRVNDLESKLGALEQFREERRELEAKRTRAEMAAQNQRQQQTDMLARLRNAELSRLRNDVAMMCAGITVRNGGQQKQGTGPSDPGRDEGQNE